MIEQKTYFSPLDANDLRFFFRYEQANARTEYLPHSHPWGQAIFVRCNVLQMQVAGERLLTPTAIPIWIPPHVEHASYNHRQAHFHTLNIAASLCDGLPERACLLTVSPVVQSIIEDCAARKLLHPVSSPDWRLCEVLLDQLRLAEVQQSYLPTSRDKYLAPVLDALEQDPADNRSLAKWAQRVYTTERTLSRRCRSELGMAFSEWRQRLRFLHAISLLEQGKSVQEVALALGYSSASAMIVMFQQQSGTTPERYRQRALT
ncbi:helix-turn-helix transcriptional regulator [Erwinia sp. P6884]|uniref:AraC family transcriptional regulator n=1 Tax=Erwinia sp. P6884 TaxID=3141450 RepID=UPI00318D0DB0